MMTYKISITLRKFLISVVEVALAGLIAYLAKNPLYLGLIPIAEAVRNFLKNYEF